VASNGARKGVAFGASLLNGKVLDDDGFGTDDTVIAGMEWAAQHHAKVVNLSLGEDVPSDGSDPASQTVDQLTAADHTLFVIAAGNSGPAPVGSPAAADAALTVGAVDGNDQLANFSTGGPRLGDDAIKPELTAPGVDIIEARAAGTTLGIPVGKDYVTLSGTSMATPHVAGAAAILAQQHPDWSPEQLKAALVATAAPASGGDELQVGSGRVDIASALGIPVVGGQAAVNLGVFAWPQTSASLVTRTLTWTNPGTSPVTLDLGVQLRSRAGGSTPAGLASLSPATLAVAPGGSASATLTVSPAAASSAPGLYDGAVTATPRGGRGTMHTLLDFDEQPPSHDLTVKAVPLPGTPTGATIGVVDVVNIDDASQFAQFQTATETLYGIPPVSTRSSTVWTFHSAAPASDTDLAPVPLLLLDYQLPLDLNNHPDGTQATFQVHPQDGTPAQTISQFTLETSTDGGATWTQAPSHALGAGRFQATLPAAAPGTWMALRADARSTTGNRVQQTIIHAYRTATP